MSSYQARVGERDVAQRKVRTLQSETTTLRAELREKNESKNRDAAQILLLKQQLFEKQSEMSDLKDKMLLDEEMARLSLSDKAVPAPPPVVPPPPFWVPPEGFILATGLIFYNPKLSLGLGSSGTIVYKGFFGDALTTTPRECAVKKMNAACSIQAKKEIEALLKIDSHPNIVKYYHMEENLDFIFLALELCSGNLEMLIQKRPNLVSMECKQDIIKQSLAGLEHLHKLHMSHRDIKPANILFVEYGGSMVIKLADLGFARQLDSSTQGASIVARSRGWQPAEVLDVFESKIYGIEPKVVLPKFADIFSMGLVIFNLFSNGLHPFGCGLKVESNILDNDRVNLNLQLVTVEVEDLVIGMIPCDPFQRFRVYDCMSHPALWSAETAVEFLKTTSDFLMGLEKRNSVLFTEIKARLKSSVLLTTPLLDWRSKVDTRLMVGHGIRYSDSVVDLLRLLRNKEHHFDQIDLDLKLQMDSVKTGVLKYFLSRFPLLFIETFKVMARYYCTPVPALLVDLKYLKQKVLLSNAAVNFPEFNNYYKNFSIKYFRDLQL